MASSLAAREIDRSSVPARDLHFAIQPACVRGSADRAKSAEHRTGRRRRAPRTDEPFRCRAAPHRPNQLADSASSAAAFDSGGILLRVRLSTPAFAVVPCSRLPPGDEATYRNSFRELVPALPVDD